MKTLKDLNPSKRDWLKDYPSGIGMDDFEKEFKKDLQKIAKEWIKYLETYTDEQDKPNPYPFIEGSEDDIIAFIKHFFNIE